MKKIIKIFQILFAFAFYIIFPCIILYGCYSNSNSTTEQTNTKPIAKKNTNNAANMPVKAIPKSGVITGYDSDKPLLNNDGLCELTIDNSRNDMPVYVRVWDMNYFKPVRAFFIAKGDSFTAYELSPGTYEVRYIELYDNSVPSIGAKSEMFELEQIENDYGVEYSQMSLTLYKVVNGNTTTTSIPADQI